MSPEVLPNHSSSMGSSAVPQDGFGDTDRVWNPWNLLFPGQIQPRDPGKCPQGHQGQWELPPWILPNHSRIPWGALMGSEPLESPIPRDARKALGVLTRSRSGAQRHHPVVGERSRLELHALLASLHLHLALPGEKPTSTQVQIPREGADPTGIPAGSTCRMRMK